MQRSVIMLTNSRGGSSTSYSDPVFQMLNNGSAFLRICYPACGVRTIMTLSIATFAIRIGKTIRYIEIYFQRQFFVPSCSLPESRKKLTLQKPTIETNIPSIHPLFYKFVLLETQTKQILTPDFLFRFPIIK